MEHQYILTDEEKCMVDKMRAEREADLKHRVYRLELLKVAYEYEKWLQENGAGTSYSTFWNDFGYSRDLFAPFINGNGIYEHVISIRQYASVAANGMVM